ncbi:hypothetical protein ACWED2_09970 [Amycolatopsis sp. NPDC005003]
MTGTPAIGTTTTPTITVAAQRIAVRVGDLTLDQLRAAVQAAVAKLDDEAAEEVGSGGYFHGPALSGLNAMAEAIGLPPVSPDDFADEEDFFV